MARDFHVPGEAMVSVKGPTGSSIASLSQLGLGSDSIIIRPTFKHVDITVDAWGEVPPEEQFMLAYMDISMNLVHFDRPNLEEVERLSMGGGNGAGTAVGLLPRAGTRMGGGVAIGAAGNNYIQLYIASPVDNKPWYFPSARLSAPGIGIPMGVRAQIMTLSWRAIPYAVDPWNSGSGAAGTKLFDHTTTT